ncbi:Xbp1p [Sporobolomyces koalae]|uniref:Xbp1p n=1 Tax=Sporobolomyces koalae TaxID=500713 RepID=UPI00317AB656
MQAMSCAEVAVLSTTPVAADSDGTYTALVPGTHAEVATVSDIASLSPLLTSTPSMSRVEADKDGVFKMYQTDKTIVERNYATSSDTRGSIYEYQIRSSPHKVMVDRETGYVLITGFWKALGRIKADVIRLIESQPEIAPVVRKIRGGLLEVQGTWLPFEIAKKVAQRVAWPLRDELIPVFGPSFPSTCLSPDQPGFGDLVLSDPGSLERHPRGSRDERRARAKMAAHAAQNNSTVDTISQAMASRRAASEGTRIDATTIELVQLPQVVPQPPRRPVLSAQCFPSAPPSTSPALSPVQSQAARRQPTVAHVREHAGHGAMQPKEGGLEHGLPRQRQSRTISARYAPQNYGIPRYSHPVSHSNKRNPYHQSIHPRSYHPYHPALQLYQSRQSVWSPSVDISGGGHLPTALLPQYYPPASHASTRRHASTSLPAAYYVRHPARIASDVTLPPRSSFSSYTPAFPLPVASLRSTLTLPSSPPTDLLSKHS